jgi:error-prone DNA polymerase
MSLRYAELQITTNYSFLRGASHAGELVAQAKALGLSAIAITDRNTLAGVVRAHVATKDDENGPLLRLVIGARLDLEDAPSLLVYPKDRAAYGRLCRLLSLGQLKADKGKCILHLTDVAEYAEGQIFIALPPDDWDWREVARTSEPRGAQIIRFDAARASSLPRGEGLGESTVIPSPRSSREERQELREPLGRTLHRMKEALGTAPLYLAASHVYRGNDRARIAALAKLGESCGTPIVATNDVLYHHKDRRPLQDVVTCIREKTTLREAGLRLEANAERHIKSPGEMARLFRGFEQALARTLDIVEACTFSLDDLKYEYPDEPVPPGKTPQQHLENLTWEGTQKYFPDGVTEKIKETIEKELKLIAERQYAPYFLTVHDIVAYARSQNILCQGRGSAANSVVCYCLGITAVNPIEVDLLFERFISSSRKEPPDIDVDFEHERREEVIQWIYKRYGRDRAGLAATVISYRSRSAVRDVGKVFGLSEDTISALAGMVWGTYGGSVPPDKHIREAGLDPLDQTMKKVMELAQELMGFPRHLSQHVGGFVLTRGPLVDVVPVGNAAMEKRTFIEWDKDDIAALGLMKVDVLALGMLTCIRKAFDLIEKHHGRQLTLASMPRDDEDTYDMLCRADSIGVFQVESRAQMNMLPRLKPRNLYDLVIEVAIVRPGPIQGDMVHPYLRRRAGKERPAYPSPKYGEPDELKNILGKTLGVPLFQEQAMRIAMVAAKFDDKEVSDLRKAMATFRRAGTIGQLEDKMISRMVERGYDRDFATRCFAQIKGFGEYGFPESHAASFALLVYASAWIKCKYPAAFACALLNSQPMGFYAPAQIVSNAIGNGVRVLDADVNFSDWDSTLEKTAEGDIALRLGLRMIDGLQERDIHEVPEKETKKKRRQIKGSTTHLLPSTHAGTETQTDNRFREMQDVAKRGNVHTLEKLAAADAFRSIGLDRRQALWEVKAVADAPPLPLFAWGDAQEAGREAEVRLPEMPLSEHVINDYQTLRLSLKAHPMSFLRDDFRKARVLSCSETHAAKDGQRVQIAGVVLVRQRPGTGNAIFMTIEDETGIANAVIWPKTFERYRKVVMTSRLIEIHGRLQKQSERYADIIHIVSVKLIDRSDWLLRLSEWTANVKTPLANANEALHPEPGSAYQARDDKSPHPRISHPKARHPRNVRIIPKSRDFH